MELGTRSVQVTHNGGHTGLVAHSSSEVDGLLWVIFGEAVAIEVSQRNLYEDALRRTS